MKKLIIVLIMIVMMVPVGICADEEPIYLGNDPTPHAKWALERDGYTIIYDLKNLLERDETEKQAIIEEIQKQRMMDAQDKQERIEL